jgi:hypothetical protein
MNYKGYKSQSLDFMVYENGKSVPFITVIGAKQALDGSSKPAASISISDIEILNISDALSIKNPGHALVIIDPTINISSLATEADRLAEITDKVKVELYNTYA